MSIGIRETIFGFATLSKCCNERGQAADTRHDAVFALPAATEV